VAAWIASNVWARPRLWPLNQEPLLSRLDCNLLPEPAHAQKREDSGLLLPWSPGQVAPHLGARARASSSTDIG